MPGYDRRGPMGSGPMTGGMRGLCNPAATGNRAPFVGGAGVGRGMGLGRGFRGGMGRGMKGGFGRGFAGYPPTYAGPYADDSTVELNGLKVQADSLRNLLDTISKRIAELEKSAE
ncbi:MAG: DUF5320 domain-containing protein [Deltaproteobacteria bacterium]|nr:DUF5320 domain-containing protein [Deltaproteobacteria bacterium]